MELFFELVIIIVFIPSHLCLNNLTYVFSHTTDSSISSFLRLTNLVLLNSTYVQRLSSTPTDLLTSTQIFLSANNSRSIVVSWNTGDCSYPASLAQNFPSEFVSSPVCFTGTSSLSNLVQLTATSLQLAQAAAAFMTRYSLHYFSMILTDSSVFYSNAAQQFSSYLSEASFIYERLISTSNFSSASINSLKSRSKSGGETGKKIHEEQRWWIMKVSISTDRDKQTSSRGEERTCR